MPVNLDRVGRRDGAVSRREQSKQETREQIRLAARDVFGRVGFDKATIRDIATAAGVGLGTVMLYAQDKRDLVLLMYNDEIALALRRAMAKIDDSAPTIVNLYRFLGSFYQGYRRNVLLARTYLQLSFYPEGLNTRQLYEHRAKKLAILEAVISRGQQRGDIRDDIAPMDMAEQVLLLHRASVRSWISSGEPKLRDGLASLRKSLMYQIEGFAVTRRHVVN